MSSTLFAALGLATALILVLAVGPTSQPSAPAPGPAGTGVPAAGTTPATGFLDKSVTVDNETYRYIVYVPNTYRPGTPIPLILFLHGAGERGADGMLETEIGVGRAIRRSRDRIPAIVIMPQCRVNDAWWSPKMTAMTTECLRQTLAEYTCDKSRIYLTGLSLGGGGTWSLAATLPDTFAAIAPICPVSEERMGFQQSLVPRLTKVPIWAFQGTADEAVPVAGTQKMVAALKAAGANVKYTEFPGGTHLIWDKVYDDPEFWKWLFEQKREK